MAKKVLIWKKQLLKLLYAMKNFIEGEKVII